jgi:TatD DNase family protein
MGNQNPLPPVKRSAVDTHCHLFLLDRPAPDVTAEANEAGVGTLVCVGIDPETSRRSLELADSLPRVFATAGMHPHEASEFDHRAGAEIEGLLANPHVVGVGETGLDFFRMHSPKEDQERVFRAHVDLGRELGKPLVVHVRDAWPDALRVLDEGSAEHVVLHCFSGDAEIAGECERRGYFLSFAGNLTYPKNERLREAVAAVSMDRLLVETDSPFLSPQKMRRRDNAPVNAIAVIEEMARVRGESFERVRDATAQNSMAAFPGIR